jgi:signal transduction histidine kinase
MNQEEKKQVLIDADQLEKMNKLLEMQEKSAKLLIRRDLELSKANEKLMDLDTRKSEFVSIVAHQLRTPLSGTKWTLNMLINGEIGPLTNDQKAFLMKGYENNERMISLVEDMLGADQVESGKFHYQFVETQITDLIDNILLELQPLLIRKNLRIVFTGKEGLPKVSVDQEKMRAVFQNLIDNAIKYTKAGGEIKINLKKDENAVTVAISDDGIGIPLDQQKNIFGRFFRARNALKVQTDGSGLGLYIVKSIIEKHGGRVWFESVENKGTSFYFTIKTMSKV